MIALPEWRVEPGLLAYPLAIAGMEARAAAIRDTGARELIWLVEHPPLYTAGTSTQPADLLDAERFPVFTTGRGGRYTYHGPGQRVVYVLLDLDARGRDIRRFVAALEAWIITALADHRIDARVIHGKVGVWTGAADAPAKIAAIGIRVRRWVSYHGFAINVEPDLEHFAGIVPCGLPEPVTSMAALGIKATVAELDASLAVRLGAVLAGLGACP